jgi:hypothetical protein
LGAWAFPVRGPTPRRIEIMRRLSPALVLSAALLAGGGCTDPYGRVDYGRTALLGVGVGAAAALTAGALSDRPRPYYGNRRNHYGSGVYGYGAPRGYGYSSYGYGPQRGYDYGGGYGRRGGGYYGGW